MERFVVRQEAPEVPPVVEEPFAAAAPAHAGEELSTKLEAPAKQVCWRPACCPTQAPCNPQLCTADSWCYRTRCTAAYL